MIFQILLEGIHLTPDELIPYLFPCQFGLQNCTSLRLVGKRCRRVVVVWDFRTLRVGMNIPTEAAEICACLIAVAKLQAGMAYRLDRGVVVVTTRSRSLVILLLIICRAGGHGFLIFVLEIGNSEGSK